MPKLASLAKVLLLGALVVSCGPNKVGGDDTNGNGGDGGNGGGGGNGDGGGGGGGGGNGDGGGFGSACATSSSKAQQTPLDLFIMLDQSKSMDETATGGGSKWTAVTSALDTFVAQPNLTGVSVGLQFFGVKKASGGNGDSCTASDYATPAVEIGPLPGNGSAISTSIAAHSPSTETPTSAALQGAVDHAQSWATAHTGDVVVAVLATDGEPTECDTTLSDIDAIAATGVSGTPKVLTFVIGVGSALSNLDGIAAAGGTGSAFQVDTGGNTNQEFLDAMNAIRHSAIGCQYAIPAPATGTLNYTEVNVTYTPGGGGATVTFPNVTNMAACPASGDGWYYDNDSAPTQIILCGSTCTMVEGDSGGEVDVALGCSTVIN
jgi:hypothetical protein